MSPSGKAPDFDSGIRRFESCHPSQVKTPYGSLAQLVEQRPFKAWVQGSSPWRATKNADALWVSAFLIAPKRLERSNADVRWTSASRRRATQKTCIQEDAGLFACLSRARRIKGSGLAALIGTIPTPDCGVGVVCGCRHWSWVITRWADTGRVPPATGVMVSAAAVPSGLRTVRMELTEVVCTRAIPTIWVVPPARPATV